MASAFLDILKSELQHFKLAESSLSEEQLRQLSEYCSNLEQWNEKTDLIAPCSREELVERHIKDSIIALDLVLTNLKPCSGPWLDVGSGAGLPGLVWAICLPGISFKLIEPRMKRVLFLNEMRRKLNLENLSVAESRFETFHVKQSASVVCCRALGSRPGFLKTARERLASDGFVVELLGSGLDLKSLTEENLSFGFEEPSALPYSSSELLASSGNPAENGCSLLVSTLIA